MEKTIADIARENGQELIGELCDLRVHGAYIKKSQLVLIFEPRKSGAGQLTLPMGSISTIEILSCNHGIAFLDLSGTGNACHALVLLIAIYSLQL